MKYGLMKFLAVFALCPVAGGAAWGSGPLGSGPVSVTLQSAFAKTSWSPGGGNPERNFYVDLEISIPVFWKMAYGREKDISLDMCDSSGSRAAALSYDVLLRPDSEPLVLEVEAERWLPAHGASWVAVKGTVPCVIGKKDAISEGVSFTIGKKGQKIPLVLKGAAMADDGQEKDAKSTLGMSFSRDEDSGDILMEVELESLLNMGILGMELRTPEGEPFPSERYSWGYSSSSDSYSWYWTYRLPSGAEGNISVFVNYITGLEELTIPVAIKFGMSGPMEDSQKSE